MGKMFLHGRGNKKNKSGPRAILTVSCPAGLTVCAESVESSLAFSIVANENNKAVFDRLTAGAWDITVRDVDNPPIERMFIDNVDCDVSFPYTTIYVTYPYGSICTCRKDDTVIAAPDRSGTCSFDIYDLGNWTVESTNGVESDSEVVSVATFDDIKSVKLLHDIYIIDYTGQRQVFDPAEFWGNDDENVKMTVNNDGSVSFKFLSEYATTVISNMALDFTDYSYVYITSVLDCEGAVKMSVLHPASAAEMSGAWTIDKDTAVSSIRCNAAAQSGSRLLQIGSSGGTSTTLTIRSMSLREPPHTKINVTYPPGSTCTCSKGDTVLTASDKSGSYIFKVYDTGDWTIHATNNVEYDTKTVTVESLTESHDVSLVHDLWFVDGTGQRNTLCDARFTARTGNIEIINNEDGTVTLNKPTTIECSVVCAAPFDATNYNHVTVNYVVGNASANVLLALTLHENNSYLTYKDSVSKSTIDEAELIMNLSRRSGSFVMGFTIFGDYDYTDIKIISMFAGVE